MYRTTEIHAPRWTLCLGFTRLILQKVNDRIIEQTIFIFMHLNHMSINFPWSFSSRYSRLVMTRITKSAINTAAESSIIVWLKAWLLRCRIYFILRNFRCVSNKFQGVKYFRAPNSPNMKGIMHCFDRSSNAVSNDKAIYSPRANTSYKLENLNYRINQMQRNWID